MSTKKRPTRCVAKVPLDDDEYASWKEEAAKTSTPVAAWIRDIVRLWWTTKRKARR